MDRIFILDRSGSMEACRDDTIGGFNAFLREQQAEGGTLTLILFDHEYSVSYTNKPISDVEPLTINTFVPRGATALLDAIGKAIKNTQSNVPTVVILTDGQENSSQEYTKAHIKDLIEQKTKDGWTFGIAPTATANFDTRRTPEAFRALSAAMSSQASNNAQGFNFNTQVI